MEFDPNEFLTTKIKSDIKTLYVQFLYMIEDLVDKNKINESEFELLRKRILDYGNNATRSIVDQLKSFEVKIK